MNNTITTPRMCHLETSLLPTLFWEDGLRLAAPRQSPKLRRSRPTPMALSPFADASAIAARSRRATRTFDLPRPLEGYCLRHPSQPLSPPTKGGPTAPNNFLRGRPSGNAKYQIIFPRMYNASKSTGDAPPLVIFTWRNSVFMPESMPWTTPRTSEPYLRCTTTVSYFSR